jgi:pSer/pThr/pTyr-binding forkhead associated (FHA) protein
MDNKERSEKIEQLSVAARLNDLAVYMHDGQPVRLQKIFSVLEQIDPGVYLIGTGPYTQGVFSLMCDEVVIGRLATVLERPLDKPIDIFVNDAATLTPREVSRVHCAIYRQEGVLNHDYWIIDRASTCGTYVNQQHLETPKSETIDETRRVSRGLSDGDVISLGPSLINSFVFVDLRR